MVRLSLSVVFLVEEEEKQYGDVLLLRVMGGHYQPTEVTNWFRISMI